MQANHKKLLIYFKTKKLVFGPAFFNKQFKQHVQPQRVWNARKSVFSTL
jgi:hypothetical protein